MHQIDRRTALLAPLAGLAMAGAAGCAGRVSAAERRSTLRLGYFANLTHLVPLLGVAGGHFRDELGPVRLETSVFNAGPAAAEALLADAIDVAYLGPSPAINTYVRTKRRGVRVVAGAATGGAALVTRPEIREPGQLRGTTLATPQLGGTQDVALRAWLLDKGFRTDTTGGSDVSVVAQSNAQTLDLFRQGEIDGAWLPEPWVSRLVIEAGARVLVDERSLWPKGRFPTTQVLVTQSYLAAAPAQVSALLRGHVRSVTAIQAEPSRARRDGNSEIKRLTGKAFSDEVIDRAYGQLDVGWDPVASAFTSLAAQAVTAGTMPRLPRLDGIVDLRLLNTALAAAGKPAVSSAGLGAA
ncbi:MAG: ABC transporter substrate-binding protein [Micrococcales bacterium]|nr:ABC transporter substrate-binding protein [Micrococcales bacterium]